MTHQDRHAAHDSARIKHLPLTRGDAMLGACDLAAFIPTTDKARAQTFYEDTLGLTFVTDAGFALIFDANGTTLRVTPVEKLEPHGFTVLGWEVADITPVVRSLTAKGVTFERFTTVGITQDADGVWHAPGGDKVAWFKDPDGNLLSVSSHDGT